MPLDSFTVRSNLAPCAIFALLAVSGCGGGDNGGEGAGDGNDPPATGGANGTGGAGTGTGGSPGGSPATFECVDEVAEPGAMVAVPEGEFFMGCNPDVDDDCVENEMPGRTVFVSSFEIDETLVTQAEYAACVNAGACSPPGACQWDCSHTNYPAACITRPQAIEYCEFAGKRLPTEAEWEKAARGTDGRKYPWGNEEPTCELTVQAGCTDGAAPVGSVPAGASPYGALDMAGNVVEMVADWYDPAYYTNAPNSDPTGPSMGPESKYVGRGGGYRSEPFWHRASVRDWYVPTDAGLSLGFRCAR